MSKLNQFKEELQSLLVHREPMRIEGMGSDFREASVLVPLFVKDGEYWLLFMKRTDTVEHHKGEVSFPGGVVDEDDESLERTAVRETFEEVGVRNEDIEILGQLDDITTLASRFIIHPFVGIIPFPYGFKLSRREVEHLIKIPLQFFFDTSQPQPHPIENYADITESPAFIYKNHLIWGATERILVDFVHLIRSGIRHSWSTVELGAGPQHSKT